MSVVFPTTGEAFTLRIYKKLVSNPSLAWVNSYELRANNDGTALDVAAAVGAVVDFESKIHLIGVQFDRAVFSTWLPDGQPHNPTSFVVFPLLNLGQRNPVGAEALSLNNVLFTRRVTAFGNAGKIYYRRTLHEADIISPSGTPALDPNSTITADLNAAQTDADMVKLFDPGNALSFYMIAQGQPVRPITEFVVAGTRIVQFNNRYFDVP